MKRYLIFAGQLAPQGGWKDFRHDASEALEAAQIAQRYEWAQVVDTATKEIVFAGHKTNGTWLTTTPAKKA